MPYNTMLKDEEIIEILGDWNFWKEDRTTGIIRTEYLEKLKSLANSKEIIDITGVRRSGKSTLMKQLIHELILSGTKKEHTLYVNFEEAQFEPELSLQFLERIFGAYKKYINRDEEAYIFLDEIQNIDKWEKWVRTAYDKYEGKIKIFVSGSSAGLLRSELSATLTGRHMSFEVYPLSFREFLYFKGITVENERSIILESKKIKLMLMDYLEFGGFPEAVLRTDAKDILKQYFDDIVFRDVGKRHKIREIGTVRSVAVYLLSNISKYFTYNKLKNSIPSNPSLETVINYIDYLESAFLIFNVPVFSYKVKEQMQHPRKIYCIDTGMRNAVSFRFRENLGQIAENAVFLELKRNGKDVHYWMDGQSEVDFVVRTGLKPTELIQVCWNLDEAMDREVKGLLKAMEEFKLKQGIIISENLEKEETINGKKIFFVPLWKWLLSK